jgi:hypothetical protein
LAQFERELAAGLEHDETPLADRPFGAYYHWCALLSGFSEAVLEHPLLSELQLEALRPDLETSLPRLRACRQLLVVIPASLEDHPRIVDLLRDGLARRDPRFTLLITLTRDSALGWPGGVGCIDLPAVQALVEGLDGVVDSFVCGPDGFVEAASELLLRAG